MTNRGNWKPDPSDIVVHVPSNSMGMVAAALDAVGAGFGDGVAGALGDGVMSGDGVGVGPAVGAGTTVGEGVAVGSTDGPAADEQAMSSPATETAISIAVRLLARIGQLPGRLVGARVCVGPNRIVPGAGETLRRPSLLQRSRTSWPPDAQRGPG
jgi:hypothetical protein